jgi:hypothetical protein
LAQYKPQKNKKEQVLRSYRNIKGRQKQI